MFLKEERITFTDKVYQREKRAPQPGPDKYLQFESWTKQQPRVPGSFKNKSEKIGFVDELTAHSSKVPAVGRYEAIDLEKYKARSLHWKV